MLAVEVVVVGCEAHVLFFPSLGFLCWWWLGVGCFQVGFWEEAGCYRGVVLLLVRGGWSVMCWVLGLLLGGGFMWDCEGVGGRGR